MDLSHVDIVHSSTALSSNQKSTNSLDVTAGGVGGRNSKILVNPPVFANPVSSSASPAYPVILGQKDGDGGGSLNPIIKSTNLVSGKMQPQQLLANSLLGQGSLHFQHSMQPSDKPEDLSSHLTFHANGYAPPSVGSGSVESVNNMLSKTSTAPTLIGVGPPKPVLSLRDLSLDSQQQSIYDIVYQKGVMTQPATATATGRRRTISNNSTG